MSRLNDSYRDGKSTSIVKGVSVLDRRLRCAVVASISLGSYSRQRHGRSLQERPAPIILPLFRCAEGIPAVQPNLFPRANGHLEEREGLREVMVRHDDAIGYVTVRTDIVR